MVSLCLDQLPSRLQSLYNSAVYNDAKLTIYFRSEYNTVAQPGHVADELICFGADF